MDVEPWTGCGGRGRGMLTYFWLVETEVCIFVGV